MKKLYLFAALMLLSTSMFAKFGYNVLFTETDYKDTTTVVENVGYNAWENNTIRLSRYVTEAFNWENKHVIIALEEGTPDSLYFNYKQNSSVSTSNVGFRVREGATLSALTEVKTIGVTLDDIEHTAALKLQSTTRYISLEWHGNYVGYYYNIMVTPFKAEQTITWSEELAADTIHMYVGDSFDNIASSTSELDLYYELNKQTEAIEIVDNTLTALAADSVVVTPKQDGAMFYLPAQGAPKLFVITVSPTTALDEAIETEKAQKVMINGKLYILRDGKCYDILGSLL